MADNVVVTAGTGTTVHADEYTHTTLGSGKTQLVKLVDGTLDSDTAITVDVGAKANALRVAPANDITDGTYIGDINFGEGLPANSGVDIGDVDVTSIVPGVGATNLGKARDAAAGANDVGIAPLAIRDDVISAITPAEGDWAPLRVNANGALHVTGSAGSTQYAEDDAHGSGDTGTMALAVRFDAGGTLCGADGDYAPVQVDANGALRVTGGGGGTEYTEDVATANPIVGTATLMERDDALGALTPVEGDWAALRCDANGALWVHDDALDAALDGAYLNVNVNAAGTDLTMNAGVLTAQTQRVTIATDDEVNNFLGTIDADTGNMVTALQLLDNAVDGNYLNTNINIAGTDCVGNAGVNAAGVLRVTIATDDECNNFLGTIDADTGNMVTALQLLDNAVYVDDADWADNTSSHLLVGGVYQSAPHTVTDGDVSPFGVDVNGNIVLGTGAKAIGKLAANTGVDIGDVDVTSIVPGVGATNLGKAEDAGHSSGDVGVMAMTVRQNTAASLSGADADYQPLITDTNGRLHVLDANSGGILTALQIIDDWDDGDYCNVNLNIAGTDVSANAGVLTAQTLRVTIATDDECNNFLGTIDADTGNMVTALQIIDDWDAVHDSAASSDGPQIMAVYDATKPTAVADGDAVRVLSDEYGRLLSGVEKTRWQEDYDSADATGEGETVKASAASTVIVVQSYVISSDVEGWIMLQEEDSSQLTGKFWLKAGGGVAITLPDKAPLVLGVDSDLEVICEAAGNVSVSATGYTIPG